MISYSVRNGGTELRLALATDWDAHRKEVLADARIIARTHGKPLRVCSPSGMLLDIVEPVEPGEPRAPGLSRLDLTGLRLALQVLRTHTHIIESSRRDLGLPPDSLRDVCAALVHIIEEDHRDSGTRGSS